MPCKEDLDDWLSVLSYDIYYPQEDSYLQEYKTGFIRSHYGSSVYAYAGPSQQNFYVFKTNVKEGEKVTVIAEENGYACIRVESTGRVVWVGAQYIGDE